MPRKKPKLDVAWIKLQAGLLRVDIEAATVEAFHPRRRRWTRLVIHTTNESARGDCGYLYVTLSLNIGGRRVYQSAFLHRLVKMAACGERLTPDEEVDHIDANKENNAWWNLEVVTGGENIRRRDERRSAASVPCADDQPYGPWSDEAA